MKLGTTDFRPLIPLAAWALMAPVLHAAPTLTFVSGSDTHFMNPDTANDLERTVLGSINSITNRTLGGAPIRSMRGMLCPGDLIDKGMAAEWASWSRDFGLTGGDGAVLKYPVYEDFGGTGHDGVVSRDAIVARNARRIGLTATGLTASDNFLYSWDWNGIHFVAAGIVAGTSATDTERIFLANDLATHVGTSGRPVVIMEHDNPAMLAQDLYDTLLKDYNVILIVDGHQAGGASLWNGIQVLDGNGFLSGYWVVQINGNTLKAGRTTGGSGNLTASVTRTITWPASVASITEATSGSWDRPALWSGGVTPQSTGDHASLDGTTPATLTLDGPRTLSGLNLDATGSGGYALAPGQPAGNLTLQKTAGSVSVSATGNHEIAAPVILANDAAVHVDSNSQLTLSGGVSGEGRTLAKAGAGTLALGSSNSYSGPTIAACGMLRLAHPGGLPGGIGAAGGTSNLTINGGMVELTDTDFLRPLGTGVSQVQFIGSGGFSSLGSAGDRSVNLGNAAAQVTWGSGGFVPAGATLRLGSTSGVLRFLNPVNLGTAARMIEVPAGTARLDGGVSGTGGLTKSGAGTLILPRAGSYTGVTTLAAGTLQLGADDVAGGANDFTLAGTVTGSGMLVKDGPTTVTLNGANSHLGGTTVNGGTLRLGNAGVLGFGAAVTKGANLPGTTVSGLLDLNGKSVGGNFTLAGGALVNNSASPATIESLAGLTTSNGGAAVPAGSTIGISGGGGAGAAATPSFGLTLASFTFSAIGRDYVVGDILYITGGGGSGCRVKVTSLGASNGVGTVSLVDPGSGYTSAPTGVEGGGGANGNGGRGAAITGNAENFQVASLTLTASGGGYSTPPAVSLSGGTGFAAGAVLSSVDLTGNGELGGTGDLTIAAPIAGAFGITKSGAGTVTLTGTSTYTGITTVVAGTLKLGPAGSIAASSGVMLHPGCLLDVSNKTSYAMPAAQTHTFHLDGSGAGSGGRIHAAGLDITNAVVAFEIDSPLNDPAYVLADYVPPLVGTRFASVTPPAGYRMDYTYNGGTQIALVSGKSPASVTLGNLIQYYDGTPKPVLVVTDPAGLAVDLTYNGVAVPPSAIGDYAVTATVSDPNYEGSASGTLSIRALTFSSWQADHFSPEQISAGQAAWNADPDRDGLANLAEYALGADPNAFTPPPAAARTGEGLILTFQRPRGLPDLTYAAESSDDLVHWTPRALELVADGPVQTLRAVDPLTTGNPARRVIRLRFTSP